MIFTVYRKIELRHDKTNKMSMRPAKTQISLGICPDWSVFAVRMKKAWVLSYPLSAQQRLWSDFEDAQADMSLRWAHMPLCWFVMRQLKLLCCQSAGLKWKISKGNHLAIHKRDSSLVMKKPVFGDLWRGKTQTGLLSYRDSKGLAILDLGSKLYYPGSKQQRCWPDCGYVQADLRLCCSHMP